MVSFQISSHYTFLFVFSACAGDGFTILLTHSGSLLSCGDNTKYALGHDDCRSYHSPKIINKLEDVLIEQITSGQHHILALSSDGSVYTWGTSLHGALGLGNLQVQ